MSAPDHAARMSPVSVAAIVRYGRHKYTLIRRMPRRVAPLLVRMMARLLGARAAWGRTAAALALLTGLSAHAAPLPSNTLPTGATLAAGQATVAQSGNRMDIVQQSGKAILNWDTFNIGSGAAVTFRQPGADSVILNRVASNAPSLLQGSLSANGKVWLVNPAGIMVGQGATLDLHGFVASTLAVRDADFLAGRMLFNATPQAALGAMVRNDGTIATPSGGSVYLVGPDVQNHGVIRAPNGEVLLAAGASVELLDTATPGVRVAVTGTGGSALNLGQIVSTAGRIGMAGVLVKNSGVLNASSVVSEGGRIFLRATQSAVADGAAQMLATGSGSGGRIEMTGDSVAVQGTALLDASGGQGGGTVLVGGDYQGGGSLSRAQTALLGADAVLRADALASGDGGKVVLWSDRATAAQGTISARGGAQGGDGGMVETSGLRHLSIDGLRTDTTAVRGKTGTLLLDPANIIIGAVADVDGTGLGGDAGVLVVDPAATVVTLDAGTYAGNTSKMTAGSIATLLATTSVSLAASTDITVDSKIEKTAGGDQSLTLNAGRDIVLRQPINSTSGKLGLNLTAGRTIQSDTFGSQSLNGGALTATAAGDLSLSNAVAASVSATSTSGSVVVNAPGALNLSGSAGSQYVVTAGGDVTLTSLTAGGDIGMNVDGHQILFKGGTLASGGNQYYQGNLALAGGTTVNSGGTVDFVGNLGGTPGLAFALGVTNTGLATFGGVVDNVASLNVSGTSLLKGNVTTVGAQSYGGQVRIAGPVVLKGSSVTLGGGGLGNAGLAAAPLTIQAQNTALSGTFEGFARVNTGGSLAVTSLAMPSQWFHTGALALANNGTLSASGGTTLTGPVTLGTDAVLTLAATAADTVSGGIGGAGSIVKSGAGATAFNSANTYTGGTTVNGGTLTVGAANALGSGDLTIGAAGTLDTSGFAQTVNSVSSAGTISAATGTLTATNGFTLTGGTVSGLLAGGGMAQMAGAVTLSGSYSGGAIRVLGGGMTIGSAGLQAGAALLQTASGTTLAINGPTATANLLNNGVVDLGAALSVAGGVSENAGAININGAAGQFAMAAGTAFTNVAAGSVTLAGTHATPVSGGGTFANAGTFSKTSAGAQTAVLTSNTGTVSVSSGTLTLSGMAANGGTLTVGNGATVATASGTLANGADGVLAGSGTIAANVVNQGTLSPGGAGAIGTLTIDGTLDTSAGAVNTELTSAASYDKVAATGAVTVGAATVINRTDLAGAYASGDAFDVVQSTATQLAGTLPAVSGFDVEKASPSYHALRLTSQAGDNFWILKSGGTYVSGAWDVAANWLLGLPTAAQMVHIARPDTLTVTLNGTSGPASISGLDLGKANTLALTGKAALALGDRVSKLAGVIDVGGGSVLSRAGDLALAATGVLQGSGTVDVGSGMFTNNGKVIPGGAGIGTLQIKGNYTQGNGGVLAMELGGPGAGQSDLLAVTGKAVLDGALTAELMGSYKPVAFQPIAIVTAGERAGTFSKMTLPTGYQPGYGLAAGEAVRVNQVADANYFSNGAGTLAWDDGDNWSKRKAPGNADDVVIDTGLGLVAGAGKQAMSTLRITPGAVLDVNASQFEVKRGAVIDGTLRVNGEAAAVTLDTVTGGGALALGGGALALTGKTPTVGAFTITGGAADISKAALTVGSYTQGGGELKGDGTSSLTATSAFSQTGGVVTGLGTLDLTQASGALTLGNITANAVNAKATAGSIVQTDGMALAVGQLQVAASGDVLLPQANTIAGLRGSAGGALSVQGVAAVDGALSAGGDIALAGAGLAINAGVTSTGGNVTLQADEVDVYGGSTVASAGGGANFVKVNSLTAAQPIKFSSLGGEDTGTGLLLNARDMAAFTTPTLVLGDASHTGAIGFMDGGDIAAPNVSGTLRFVNNGAFSRNGGETITANGLEITATGGILLGGVNHVKSFAASNGGSGDIVFTNNSGAVSLALGALANPVGAITVDNTGGIAASGPGAITASGKVTLTAHSPVVINTGVTSGTGIQVTASTGITLGAAARLTNTARGPVTLLAQNGNVVLDPASRIDSGGGSTTLEARGPGGAVVAPAGSVTGGLTIASTELDNIAAAEAAAQAAAEAEAKAAAEAAAKAAADKAAAEAAAKAAADAAAKKAAEAAAKAAAEKAAAEAAAKAAADKAAAEAAAKAAADKAAAEAAAKAAADKAAAEAAAKAAADKAAAEAAAKAAAEAAAEAAAKAAAEKAAAEAAAKAAAEQAAAEAAAKAAAEAAAREAAEKAAAEAAAKAAEQAAAEAAAKAAADKAAADAAAKAAADAAAKAAAEKAAADAAAQAAAKAAADEAARQAADNAAKAAANSAKQPVQQPPQPAQDNKPQDSKPPENKPKETTPAGIAQESALSSSPATVPSSPASAALAQAFEQQTIGGGADSFGGGEGTPAGDHKDGKDEKEGKGKDGGKGASGDGKDKKAAKKMAVCR